MNKSIYRNIAIRRLTFAAMLAALYFILCLIEGSFASGYLVNVRLAEGLCVFALYVPEVIIGASIGCFLYNLFFGFGIIDAAIGTTATILGTVFIHLIGLFLKNRVWQLILFGLMLVLANACLVPVVLILCLPDDLTWASYWMEFGIVASGEALAVYGIGIPIYLATMRWLPKLVNPMRFNIEKNQEVQHEQQTQQ